MGPADARLVGRSDLRDRAVRLLETYFAGDDERSRRNVFLQAFGDIRPNPCREVDFSGAVAQFARAAVEKLWQFGGAGRGRHYLSVLLTTMATLRGRQPDADYYDLPVELDQLCALPTREEEQQYLKRLIEEIELTAQLYSPLRAVAARRKADQPCAPALLHLWKEDRNLAGLLHRARHRMPEESDRVAAAAEVAEQAYDDILGAFSNVRRAALLGAPGSGKSTTLRRLALDWHGARNRTKRLRCQCWRRSATGPEVSRLRAIWRPPRSRLVGGLALLPAVKG